MRSPRSLRSKDGMGIKGRERKRERGERERERKEELVQREADGKAVWDFD